MAWGYESMETVKDLREAEEMQDFLLTQGRSVLQGVRILLPSPAKPGFRVQAIWTDDPFWAEQVGMRRVFLPSGFLKGFQQPGED